MHWSADLFQVYTASRELKARETGETDNDRNIKTERNFDIRRLLSTRRA